MNFILTHALKVHSACTALQGDDPWSYNNRLILPVFCHTGHCSVIRFNHWCAFFKKRNVSLTFWRRFVGWRQHVAFHYNNSNINVRAVDTTWLVFCTLQTFSQNIRLRRLPVAATARITHTVIVSAASDTWRFSNVFSRLAYTVYIGLTTHSICTVGPTRNFCDWLYYLNVRRLRLFRTYGPFETQSLMRFWREKYWIGTKKTCFAKSQMMYFFGFRRDTLTESPEKWRAVESRFAIRLKHFQPVSKLWRLFRLTSHRPSCFPWTWKIVIRKYQNELKNQVQVSMTQGEVTPHKC